MVVMVLGAAGAIGSAVCQVLAEAGYTLVAADIDPRAAADLAGSLGPGGHSAAGIDVTDPDRVAAVFAEAAARHGALYGIVYCVGGTRIKEMPHPKIADFPLEEWIWTEAVNARGAFIAIREFFRHRRSHPAPAGRIVTIASLAGQLAGRNTGAAYAAAKASLLSLTRTAAVEGGPLGITANAIAPGPVDTPAFRQGSGSEPEMLAEVMARIPVGRICQPRDIGALVRHLLSDDAGFISGATMDINGGTLMRT